MLLKSSCVYVKHNHLSDYVEQIHPGSPGGVASYTTLHESHNNSSVLVSRPYSHMGFVNLRFVLVLCLVVFPLATINTTPEPRVARLLAPALLRDLTDPEIAFGDRLFKACTSRDHILSDFCCSIDIVHAFLSGHRNFGLCTEPFLFPACFSGMTRDPARGRDINAYVPVSRFARESWLTHSVVCRSCLASLARRAWIVCCIVGRAHTVPMIATQGSVSTKVRKRTWLRSQAVSPP